MQDAAVSKKTDEKPNQSVWNYFMRNIRYKVNFKIYDVINRETNNYNIHIAQYLKK